MKKLQSALIACTLVFFLPFFIGCPPPTNNNPIADAGTDQTVTGGDTVILNGSGSSDPDGDTLIYRWTQTDGTDVTLTDADTVSPSFIAPNVDETLTFELVAIDVNGGTDIDSVNVTVIPVLPILFITNFSSDNVVGYKDPTAINGDITPDINIQGDQTGLDGAMDVVATNPLFISNWRNQSVVIYGDAKAATGNLPPDRTIQVTTNELNRIAGLAINKEDNLLFVADYESSDIKVFEGFTEEGLNGDLELVGTFSSPDITETTGIFVDPNDNLYVTSCEGRILVFAEASSLDGDVIPTRRIESSEFDCVVELFIGTNDRLFVVDEGKVVHILNNAGTLNGTVEPDAIIEIEGAGNLYGIVVDRNDTAYIADGGVNAIFSFDNISSLDGFLTPDRTVQGPNTQLDAPRGLALLEP